MGVLAGIERRGESLLLKIRGPETAAGAVPGDSVAVDGVCLTVTGVEGDVMAVDVGEETYRRTTLSGRAVSEAVNLEPALRVGDRLGGHIVSGHVDATGRIASFTEKTTEIEIRVEFPRELAPFIAAKGSVSVDGISLTAGEVEGNIFSLHIIPHTLRNTTLKNRKAGDKVNLEADVLARYVVNALEKGAVAGEGNLMDKLVEFGYSKESGYA